MLRGERQAQARGAGRHRGRPDGGGEVAFVGEQARGRKRCFFLADDHRHDRALRIGQAGGFRERLGLLHRQGGVARLALDQIERGDGGGHA